MRIKIYTAAAIDATETVAFNPTVASLDPLVGRLIHKSWPIGMFFVDVSSLTGTWNLDVKYKSPVTGGIGATLAGKDTITDAAVLTAKAGLEINGVAASAYIMIPNLENLVVTATEAGAGILSCELYLYVPDIQ